MEKKSEIKWSLGLNILLGLLIIALGVSAQLVGGCGEQVESTAFFYKPTWTREGKIVFVKGLQSVKKDFIGAQTGSSYAESVNIMSATGTEEKYLFDATTATPYRMTCSPAGDYLAYLDDLSGELFYKLVIRNISSAAHSGLETVEIVFTRGIASFDWSSDGTKLVYCTTQEVRTVGTDATGDALVVADTGLEFVAWKNGAQIAFVRKVGSDKILSMINPNGSGRKDLPAAASVDLPQISAVNNNLIYGIAGGKYCSVDVSVGSPATTEVLADFKGDLPRLSQAADKIVYSKVGEKSGIYVSGLSSKQEDQIK